MAIFKWDESLSVKIQSIDKQHMKLIDMINDFYEHITCRSNGENISKLIAGMREYTQIHFLTEEREMVKYSYPNYLAHQKEHVIFIEKVMAVEEKIKSGKLIVSFELTGFLKDWLKNHILHTDKQYSNFFIEKGLK
jgi:hemerythrin